jgi:hypothetical protein
MASSLVILSEVSAPRSEALTHRRACPELAEGIPTSVDRDRFGLGASLFLQFHHGDRENRSAVSSLLKLKSRRLEHLGAPFLAFLREVGFLLKLSL